MSNIDVRRGTLAELRFDDRNANAGSDAGNELLGKSIDESGVGRGVLIANDGTLIAGNHVTRKLIEKGITDIIIVPTDGKTLVVTQRTDIEPGTKEFHALAIGDNAVAKLNINFDAVVLEELSAEFDIPIDFDVSVGEEKSSGAGGLGGKQQNEGGLAKRFLIPPFSILDTRQGYWKERKTLWRQRINDNGESRNATLRKSTSADDPGYYRQKNAVEERTGRKLTNAEFEAEFYQRSTTLPVGVSLLDPVLSELVVHWFGLQGGTAFDCFAGDSVFGFVAAATGMTFTGIELRQEQADLNQSRIDSEGLPGRYICDDGRHVAQHLAAESQDLLFSCPPYFDLEVYSDSEKDASNQDTYEGFYQILDTAFRESINCLKQNRFAVVVCGDIRDKKTGAYLGFPVDVIRTFTSAGMHFYNEMILVEQAGNAAMRASGQMKHRKVVKTHQQVLVFYKGNPRQVKAHFPEIVYEPEDLESFGMDSDDESAGAEAAA